MDGWCEGHSVVGGEHAEFELETVGVRESEEDQVVVVVFGELNRVSLLKKTSVTVLPER